MDQIFPLLGVALIVLALLQFGLWTVAGFKQQRREQVRFSHEMELLRAQIYDLNQRRQSNVAIPNRGDQDSVKTPASFEQPSSSKKSLSTGLESNAGSWSGFRKFRVARLVKETATCTSVYLSPVDEKPIAEFRPGQHLTIRFPIPGAEKPVIRCYSLSDCFLDGSAYRITVKLAQAPPTIVDADPGLVSYFVNQQLQVDELLDVKAPGGSFFLNKAAQPVVLLAGGVGITPMMSMINSVIHSNSKRQVLLVYGVNDGTDHIFRDHLAELPQQHDNIHVINCYATPSPEDKPQIDFQVKGFVSVDILRQVLPSHDYEYYLCGPPPFMKSLYNGLMDWGVTDSQIRYEAFGPATIRRREVSPQRMQNNISVSIKFAQSGMSIDWNGSYENLLEFMEQNNIHVDSGCRSGSCGTCETRLLSGHVTYQDPDQIQCEEGWCLPCMAKPADSIELDA